MAQYGKKYYVFLIIFLGMLSAFGPFVTDMYLPTLPSMADVFHTTPSLVQMGLATSMLGLALGQIFFGPLSDKYGRKPQSHRHSLSHFRCLRFPVGQHCVAPCGLRQYHDHNVAAADDLRVCVIAVCACHLAQTGAPIVRACLNCCDFLRDRLLWLGVDLRRQNTLKHYCVVVLGVV